MIDLKKTIDWLFGWMFKKPKKRITLTKRITFEGEVDYVVRDNEWPMFSNKDLNKVQEFYDKYVAVKGDTIPKNEIIKEVEV
jgi:hypothetical protein